MDVSFTNPPVITTGASYALVVTKTSSNAVNDFAMGVLSRDACTGYPFRDPSADGHWALFQSLNDIAMEVYVGTPDPGQTTPAHDDHDDHTVLPEAPFTWDGTGISAGTSAPEAGLMFVKAYTLQAGRATAASVKRVLIASGSATVKSKR